MNNKLEILAPVGSFESLKAAVSNGANAVYLGGKEFSARASANNFDRDEMINAVKYAHLRDVSVFVTVNTLIKEIEKDDFIKYIGFLYEANVDAIILQDIGMASLVKEHYPNFEIHASTQMAAHSLEDVLFLEKVGFKRVVLARELNIHEIKYITDNCKADIEVFVHGALCVAYSGQCLMSSVLGTRSGNRGRCAQPCRQKYTLYDVDNDNYVNTDGSYLLSPRDLNTIENIGKIIDTNVLSLKIEGRMKRPEYVATVVSAYKKAIDNYINTNNENVDERSIEEIYTIFNRKFTNGYLLGEVGIDIMNSQKPNNRGLYIGKVLSYNNKTKKLKIKLEKSLKKGDCLNIGGGNIGRIIKGNEITDYASANEIVEIDYVGEVEKGTELFKTSDKDLIDRVKKTFETEKEFIKIPISFDVFIYQGSPIVLNATDKDGNFVSVTGEKNAEEAIKVALDYEKVKKQLSKLGDTTFVLDELNIDIQDNTSIPVSEINNIRRIAVEELIKKREVRDRKETVEKSLDFNFPLKEIFDDRIYLNASVNNLDQLNALVDLDVDLIYYKDINTLDEAVEICREKNKKISYSLPRIIRCFENKVYNKISKLDNKTIDYLDSFRVSNYGEINKISTLCPNMPISASSWMNILNENSVEFYKNINTQRICLSQEMSFMQIKSLPDTSFNRNNIEYLVYGSREMMISEYCPMGVLTKDCKKNKRDALCNKSKYSLESSNGERFRLKQDENCRTTIYSEEILYLLDEVEEIYEAGINHFELDFVFEDKEEIKNIVNLFVEKTSFSKGILNQYHIEVDKNKNHGTGHFYKEID